MVDSKSLLVCTKMHFVKQRLSLPIQNVEDKFKIGSKHQAHQHRRHGALLPNTIRCIICGPSNCGKTNILISLLVHPNGLHFQNVYIYSKTLAQDKYNFLECILKPIKGLGYFTYSSNDAVLPPSKVRPNSIMIFDDVICDKQKNIMEYFCMGRHNAVDSFYLTQTYTRVPKHLIRDNTNLLIMFKQDDTNLKHIYHDYGVSCDLKFDQFREMCNNIWREKYEFVVIDVDSDVDKGRYRKGFDNFIHL